METQQPEKTIWEDPQEIESLLCEEKVINALSEFLSCTSEQVVEALVLRAYPHITLETESKDNPQEKVKRTYNYGYYKFPIHYPDGKVRWINDPAPVLKLVQNAILLKLRQIPVSHIATASKFFTGIKDNVTPHITKSFTIKVDLKKAFPSISGQRVHANLRKPLNKHIETSFPYLTTTERGKFKQAVVTLLVKDDEIPQGAPTSPQLLNIVLSKLDKDLITYLHNNTNIVSPVITRYADDIAVSFSCFQESLRPMQITASINNKVKQTIGEFVKIKSPEKEALIRQTFEEVKSLIKELTENPLSINDPSEVKRLKPRIAKIRKGLIRIRNEIRTFGMDEALYHQFYNLVHKLDTELTFAIKKNAVKEIADDIGKKIRQNGLKVNLKKTKIWTPQSATAREITGLTIGRDGALGIPKKNANRFITFAKNAAETPENLDQRFYDTNTGTPNEEAIALTLDGFRAFMLDVKGRVHPEFEASYKKARKRYPSGWNSSYDAPMHNTKKYKPSFYSSYQDHLKISKKSMKAYIAFARRCLDSPHTLTKQFYDNLRKTPRKEALVTNIQGLRKYILEINGTVPKEFDEVYDAIMDKYVYQT